MSDTKTPATQTIRGSESAQRLSRVRQAGLEEAVRKFRANVNDSASKLLAKRSLSTDSGDLAEVD